VTVPGPLAGEAAAAVLLTESADGVRTAYLEAAQACGAQLVPPAERDPGRTTTRGVGTLLCAARAAGARRIVVGLGGTGTNDAGAGCLLALTAAAVPEPCAPPTRCGPPALPPSLGAGGAGLVGVAGGDLAALVRLRAEWAGTELVLASDVDNPLLGPTGASVVFAAQKGARPGQAEDLDQALAGFAAAALDACGLPRDLTEAPGAGAGGGLGFALLLLGARRVPGVRTVVDAVDLVGRARGCDLLVTGEGRFDRQSPRGKVVAGVAEVGRATGVPVVVLAGQVETGVTVPGIVAVHAMAGTAAELAESLADPCRVLTALARRVAAGRAGGAGPVVHAGR
jgi:glycerate kinase